MLVLVIAPGIEHEHDYVKCLPGNIGLAEKLEPLAEEHGRRAVRVVHVQSKGGEPARMGQQRVTEMHVYLRHEERRKKFGQLGGHLP